MLMIRLQRVTFLALHDYLGLTTELTHFDDIIPSPISHQRNGRSHASRSTKSDIERSGQRSSLNSASMKKKTEKFTQIRDDFIAKENLQTSRSVVDLSCTSPSTEALVYSTVSETTGIKNGSEHAETTVSPEKQNSIPIPTTKRSANFMSQRSLSVIESNRLKPDFEEAAARARVKNSLDNALFERHKITYPNLPSHRPSSSSTTRNRTHFSDVGNLSSSIRRNNNVFQ